MPTVCMAFGIASEPQTDEPPRPAVIVVVGAPGTDQYASEFAEWAGRWEQACAKSGARFTAIGLEDAPNPADCNDLQQALAREATQTVRPLWLVLIGHGTYDGRTARFNLRGPDVSAEELAAWLKPIARPVAIINTASSSAPFLNKLSAPGRVVVTATKSGFEQNYARFGGFLAQAVVDPAADLDKDGQTSLLEAFLTASHQTSEFYTAEGRLATEHALLDDNGDALGTPADWFRGIRPVQSARDDAELDGYRAHQLCLLPSQTEAQMPPTLRAERDRLELEVMRLRDAKESLPEDEYFSRLEALLYDIARIYEQADKGSS
ncbi:MAG: hypothetical protein JW993_20995 [Sedimentisphaerales bacterium]|nr:hypothetical protein [Sedimentisphaerales bacterium]